MQNHPLNFDLNSCYSCHKKVFVEILTNSDECRIYTPDFAFVLLKMLSENCVFEWKTREKRDIVNVIFANWAKELAFGRLEVGVIMQMW